MTASAWPPPPPPRLPTGWQAVHRADSPAGQPMILLRVRPLWRRAAALGAVTGLALLAAYGVVMYTHDERGPWLWFLGYLVLSGSIGTAVITATQDGWAVTPTGLNAGRIWVATGAFRRPPRRIVALQFREDERDEVETVELIAITDTGGSHKLFHEVGTATRGEPLAAWLAAVAGIPIRPLVPRRR